MNHTPITVIVPIGKDGAQSLRDCLRALEALLRGDLAELGMLHFASFSIVDACQDTPPCLIFEANVDGGAAPFMDALIAGSAPAVDAIFGHAKGYPLSGSATPDLVREFLLSNDVGADTYYVGCRGRTVTQVLAEDALRKEIGHIAQAGRNTPVMRRGDAGPAREYLRQSILANPGFGWASPPAERPPEVRYRMGLLAGVVLIVIGILNGIGALALGFAGPLLPPCIADLSPLACIEGTSGWYMAPALATWGLAKVVIAVDVAIALIFLLLVFVAGPLQFYDRKRAFPATLQPDWTRDPEIIKTEYKFGRVQNHLACVTEINHPVWLRRFMLGVVLWVVNLFGRIWYNTGLLGGIPGIHFARWVIFDKGRRLLFLSNYDGGWDGYLSDFVQFSFQGLNAIWGNTRMADRSYPPTRSILWGGAQFEAPFKAYAGASQIPTLFWYRAYADLSNDNVDNNTAVREGITGDMTTAQADAWLRRI